MSGSHSLPQLLPVSPMSYFNSYWHLSSPGKKIRKFPVPIWEMQGTGDVLGSEAGRKRDS